MHQSQISSCAARGHHRIREAPASGLQVRSGQPDQLWEDWHHSNFQPPSCWCRQSHGSSESLNPVPSVQPRCKPRGLRRYAHSTHPAVGQDLGQCSSQESYVGPSRGAQNRDVDHARDSEAMLANLRGCRRCREERVKAWQASSRQARSVEA